MRSVDLPPIEGRVIRARSVRRIGLCSAGAAALLYGAATFAPFAEWLGFEKLKSNTPNEFQIDGFNNCQDPEKTRTVQVKDTPETRSNGFAANLRDFPSDKGNLTGRIRTGIPFVVTDPTKDVPGSPYEAVCGAESAIGIRFVLTRAIEQ